MAKFMTAARKITLARLAGIGAGAGLMQVITKDLSVVCPVAGLAVIGAAVIHRRMKDIPADTEVSSSELASVAGRAAGEVALASSLAAVAKHGVKGLLQKRTAPAGCGVEVTVEFTPAPAATPAA